MSEKTQLPPFDSLDRRLIIMNGNITDESSSEVIEKIFYMAGINDEPITLHLTTSGGGIQAMLAMVDAMRMVKAPVNILVLGRSESAGFPLVLGCTGFKACTPTTQFFMHPCTFNMNGAYTYEDLAAEVKSMGMLRQNVLNIIATGSGGKITRKQAEQMCKESRYYSAQEALALGIVDKIIKEL